MKLETLAKNPQTQVDIKAFAAKIYEEEGLSYVVIGPVPRDRAEKIVKQATMAVIEDIGSFVSSMMSEETK